MAGLIEARGLTKRHHRRGLLHRPAGGPPAVDNVSFGVERGSVFGLVGESGCGKTTLARSLLYLDPPTEGEVVFDGVPLGGLSRRALRGLRSRMQIVFQDPNAALDPKMRIRDSMAEGLVNLGMPRPQRERRVSEMLELVGIPAGHAGRWPHELSGGQKQRIVIARSLTVGPELLVLDEPVSNLDVSIQAQIINLLADLRRRLGLTYLFISHDLHLVAYLADTVGVMFRGRLVETAPTEAFMERQLHPYSRALFASMPGAALSAAAGLAPMPGGCPYCPWCGQAVSACAAAAPELRDAGGGRRVACARVDAKRRWT
jgi:peptide/nickel transport system ATP-binding protein